MKCITVYAYEIALILKRGKLVQVLPEGKHWIGFGRKYLIYDLTKPIQLERSELMLMFESPLLKDYLTVVNIGDNELGIEYKDGKFSRVIHAAKVGYWNTPSLYKTDVIDMSNYEVSDELPKHIRLKSQVLTRLRTYPVESYQKGLLYVDGEFVKLLEPGVYQYWKTETLALVKTIDTRVQILEVGGQELLTKDKAGIRVNFSLQYQVEDVMKALVDAKDYEKQLYVLMQLALREYVGTMNLDQLLANKDTVGGLVMESTLASAQKLGVALIYAGIKDIILPGDVKEIMNQVLIAQKKAQANTIMRQEETASTRSLLNTAKLMEQNAMLMKLKEMEYMEKIADKVGEISVNGKGRVMDQLTELLVSAKA